MEPFSPGGEIVYGEVNDVLEAVFLCFLGELIIFRNWRSSWDCSTPTWASYATRKY